MNAPIYTTKRLLKINLQLNREVENKIMRLRIDSILFILSLLYAQQTFSQSDTLDTEYKKFYYDNGSLSSEGSMIDGFPDGLWKTYFKSAQLKTLGERK